MKIALLQDEIYLPTFAGGIKANRLLLEGLARRGHECMALTRALTRSPDGPMNESQFFGELKSRGISVQSIEPEVYSYTHGGVHVETINFSAVESRSEYFARRIRQFEPDWVFVADDKRRCMLQSVLNASPDRVILLLQTIVQLPFGPLSVNSSEEYTALMRKAAAIIMISNFARDYLRVHGSLESHLLHMPVYGDGPFRNLARHDSGYVTMINPCPLKGLDIFLEIAKEHHDIKFAAVPTWGSDDQVVGELQAIPNVRILHPTDDIEDILSQTRILLVPSLWPETFGYVVPEAMLRGIPVLASNIGGLPEAKLGVEYLLDVVPGEWRDGVFVSPKQDVNKWSAALSNLLSSSEAYDNCSRRSRQAAQSFVAGISVAAFEALLRQLDVGQKGLSTDK